MLGGGNGDGGGDGVCVCVCVCTILDREVKAIEFPKDLSAFSFI